MTEEQLEALARRAFAPVSAASVREGVLRRLPAPTASRRMGWLAALSLASAAGLAAVALLVDLGRPGPSTPGPPSGVEEAHVLVEQPLVVLRPRTPRVVFAKRTAPARLADDDEGIGLVFDYENNE